MKTQIWILASAVCAVAFLTGCESYNYGTRFDPRATSAEEAAPGTQFISAGMTNQVQAEWLRPRADLFTLGPGDEVDIEVLGDDTTRTSTVVGPDGKVYFYLLPGIKVEGLTLGQTKSRIEKELTNYFRDQPQVSITLRKVESKRVWLLGRLTTPGVYQLSAPTTLLEAISLAGGPATSSGSSSEEGQGGGGGSPKSGRVQEYADLDRSFVLRGNRLLPVNFRQLLQRGDLSHNIYLEPGDFIYMPGSSSREVYVLGRVTTPQPVPFSHRISLVGAIAGAGGTAKDAYLSKVAVVRGSLTSPTVALVDYHAIVKGKAADVVLEPGDIVYVPLSPYDTLIRYVNLALDTFARTVGANEGANAAGEGVVGVNVPIGF